MLQNFLFITSAKGSVLNFRITMHQFFCAINNLVYVMQTHIEYRRVTCDPVGLSTCCFTLAAFKICHELSWCVRSCLVTNREQMITQDWGNETGQTICRDVICLPEQLLLAVKHNVLISAEHLATDTDMTPTLLVWSGTTDSVKSLACELIGVVLYEVKQLCLYEDSS